MKKTKTKLVTFSGDKVHPRGECVLTVETRNKFYAIAFIVADVQQPPLLGLPACEQLELIRKVQVLKKDEENGDIFQQYEGNFKGTGCLPGKYKIKVDEDVPPVVHARRKALKPKLKAELNRMETMNIITKVKHPTKWVNSMVIIEKPNKLRVCLDLKHLNEAVQRERFHLPTLEDITSKLANARVLSKLDASQAFYQIQLDEASTDLTTFNTPYARYKYMRLPYGISSAPEIFSRKMHEMFEDLEGVENFVDDLVVWGSSKQQHDERLKAVMERAAERNLKFNREKCIIGVT